MDSIIQLNLLILWDYGKKQKMATQQKIKKILNDFFLRVCFGLLNC